MIFPESFVRDVSRLPGGSYSFLRQVCSPDGERVRSWLEEETSRASPPLARRWADTLGSFDNRRFFQGYAEVLTAALLSRSGWTLEDLSWPGPTLAVRDPGGRTFDTLVLAFVRQVRPVPDRTVLERLANAINRVGGRSRIVVCVRKWLPHDFDPEPVRRAIDLWLTDADRSSLNSRYATYDDEHTSLEFALTNAEGPFEDGVVLFSLGPFEAQRTIEILETRVVFELDAYRAGEGQRPLVLSCVADQPWCISDGYLRDLLMGKPVAQSTSGTDGSYELTYGPAFSPSLFRDPLYRSVGGLILTERTTSDALDVHTRAYLSPWAEERIEPSALDCPSLALDRLDGDRPVLRWFGA
jgi:hypothetical protein